MIVKWYQGRKCFITEVKWCQGRNVWIFRGWGRLRLQRLKDSRMWILSFFELLPGPSRRLAPVIKCNAFLCFQSYIVRDISLTEIYRWLVTFIEILSAILKSTSGGVKRKIIAFWTTRFPAFMSKNLRVNIWRDKFTSDRLRVNLPSWNLSRK